VQLLAATIRQLSDNKDDILKSLILTDSSPTEKQETKFKTLVDLYWATSSFSQTKFSQIQFYYQHLPAKKVLPNLT